MQILHPFAGSVQQYTEQLADPTDEPSRRTLIMQRASLRESQSSDRGHSVTLVSQLANVIA